MKKLFGFAVVGAAALTLASCGGDDKLSIGANIYSFNDNFMNSTVKPELVSYAEELGVDLDIVDSEGSASKLVEQVETYINRGVDALVINLVDPAAADVIINKAKDANIPLVLYNKETSEANMALYDAVYYVGTASAESGYEQGQLIYDDIISGHIGQNGTDTASDIYSYALLKGEPGHADAEARTIATPAKITELLNANTSNSYTIKQEALEACADWSSSCAVTKVDTWKENAWFSDLDFIIANNDDMAMGAVQALTNAGIGWTGAQGQIQVYGIDAIAPVLGLMAEGKIAGTVLNDGVNQARAALDVAVAAANGDLTSELETVKGSSDWVFDNAQKKAIRVPYVGVGRDDDRVTSLQNA